MKINIDSIKTKLKDLNVRVSCGLLCLVSVFFVCCLLLPNNEYQVFPNWFIGVLGWTGITVSAEILKTMQSEDIEEKRRLLQGVTDKLRGDE